MATALDWASTFVAAQPVYWAGVAAWFVGFVLYVRGLLRSDDDTPARVGYALCWIGFLVAALAELGSAGRGLASSWPALGPHPTATNALWLLWTAGALMIVGRWLRLLRARAGWLGLCLAMTGVIAAAAQRTATQALVMICGVALVVLLALVSLKRGELVETPVSPGDYEAELVRLCGSRHKAERLILEEQERSPLASRAGAAMAVVTRMRVEREGLGPPL